MLNELNQKLAALQEQDRVRTKLQSRLQQVQKDLTTETARKNELQQMLAKEAADVEKLSSMGLTAIFYSILGSKEVQLHREKQEQLAAQLKYDEAAATVQDLQQEQAQLQQELESFKGLDEDFKAVIGAKEAALLAENDETAVQLNNMAEQIISLQSNTREVGEAIMAGSEVLKALEEVVEDLESAKTWGTWDMFGGGAMVTALKHGKIDDAKTAMHQVQQKLRLFNYELKDVNTNEALTIHIDIFETFSDYFFDNLIFDWVVQSKIEKSLESSLALGNKIVEVVKNLQAMQESLQHQLEEVKLTRGRLIQNAGIG